MSSNDRSRVHRVVSNRRPAVMRRRPLLPFVNEQGFPSRNSCYRRQDTSGNGLGVPIILRRIVQQGYRIGQPGLDEHVADEGILWNSNARIELRGLADDVERMRHRFSCSEASQTPLKVFVSLMQICSKSARRAKQLSKHRNQRQVC